MRRRSQQSCKSSSGFKCGGLSNSGVIVYCGGSDGYADELSGAHEFECGV
ncbi:hypothetical protein BofuT4_uP114520.1 [Botrytis cinerea T4]|uniref:Uncharacterized protein n=1 Tax=Botryotinia fuckeliana (strain T4) TaxID=999810 RepID=G2Y256_BOTF4|nr:hypothetical protein BofuT4_uP114520.1 [Botrytis cinerea T4]